MPALNLRGDWFVPQDNIGIHGAIIVSRETLIEAVQTIIDSKGQVTFKALER